MLVSARLDRDELDDLGTIKEYVARRRPGEPVMNQSSAIRWAIKRLAAIYRRKMASDDARREMRQ